VQGRVREVQNQVETQNLDRGDLIDNRGADFKSADAIQQAAQPRLDEQSAANLARVKQSSGINEVNQAIDNVIN
jgi:hypothetical protein